MNKPHQVHLYTSDLQTLRLLLRKELDSLRVFIAQYPISVDNTTRVAANHLESLLSVLANAEAA